ERGSPGEFSNPANEVVVERAKEGQCTGAEESPRAIRRRWGDRPEIASATGRSRRRAGLQRCRRSEEEASGENAPLAPRPTIGLSLRRSPVTTTGRRRRSGERLRATG